MMCDSLVVRGLPGAQQCMNVSIGEGWEGFLERIVKSGREVVAKGFEVEEREIRLAALREMLDASIAAGGEVSDEELNAAVAKAAKLQAKSHGS